MFGRASGYKVGVIVGNFDEKPLNDTCQFLVNHLLTPKRYQNFHF